MYIDIATEKFNRLRTQKDIIVLAFESSCDDTSVAVVKNGREVLSLVIASQIDIHARFGGVVPEVASRNHLLSISNITEEALNKANLTLSDIDAIAVTYGAGLVGSLMVGVNFAKSLAFALELPLIKVNHIRAHVAANYLSNKDLTPPFLALIVSGGHTALTKVEDYATQTLIGTTHDDAVGEAYDKVAKVLGLGYPGGPVVDKLSKSGNNNIQFIKPNYNKKDFNFSYSGLKTSVINYLHKTKQRGEDACVEDVCASFQCQAVEELVTKTINASKKYKIDKIALAGGVACNSHLRAEIQKACEKEKKKLYYPTPIECTDNAAMVGAEAYYQILAGANLADLDLVPDTTINLKYSNK
ncbi:MAG: tRNA (adenosine(37)-N6)-threonylcarbamoyltransferase complex transferase subunit TsaD [Clostridia bacterium]|nr:tRNA (adenosine(37)-N6)-threonylcarbamoyltransferase complex transferase subunit TsaD [Clostridia bacterium]